MRWQAGGVLRRRIGRREAGAVLRSADEKFIPPPHLARTSLGAFNLEMAAYLLALRDALRSIGYDDSASTDLLARSLYVVMRRFYLPMDALAVALHPRNRLARARWRQIVTRRIFFKKPDWLMDDVTASAGYGFDVRRCVMEEYMQSRGEQDFCRDVLCKQDLLMAQGRGEVLVREHTLAEGDDRCDFRFPRTDVARARRNAV